MYILLTFFALLNIFFGFIDYIVVGNADFYATKLTSAMSENVTTANVTSTAGFRTSDYIVIGDERIMYNGRTNTSFTNLTRGYDNTEAVSHAEGAHVYSRQSDAINSSVGFNIVDTGASVGSINTMSLVVKFVTTTVPNMVTWNFYFLKEGFWQYLRLILQAISMALVFVIAMQLLSALGGLLQSAFRR